MKMSLAVKVQIALGMVLLSGLISMAAGLDIVPKNPETKALFNRIIDAIFIVLNVPLIASLVQKKEIQNNGKIDLVGVPDPGSDSPS